MESSGVFSVSNGSLLRTSCYTTLSRSRESLARAIGHDMGQAEIASTSSVERPLSRRIAIVRFCPMDPRIDFQPPKGGTCHSPRTIAFKCTLLRNPGRDKDGNRLGSRHHEPDSSVWLERIYQVWGLCDMWRDTKPPTRAWLEKTASPQDEAWCPRSCAKDLV